MLILNNLDNIIFFLKSIVLITLPHNSVHITHYYIIQSHKNLDFKIIRKYKNHIITFMTNIFTKRPTLKLELNLSSEYDWSNG